MGSPTLCYNHNMNTTVSTKDRITLPARIRRGTRLKPITREAVHALRGKYKGRGLMKALMEEKGRERG